MDIVFTPNGWEDFMHWMDQDPSLAKKVRELIKAIRQDPFRGIGKPESLKHLNGVWSRRINREHRLVYKVTGKRGIDQRCIILQCRYHY